MSALRNLLYLLIKLPIKLLVKANVIADSEAMADLSGSASDKIFYIIRYQSASDLLTLKKVCKQQNLPDPFDSVELYGKKFKRTLCLQRTRRLFSWLKPGSTDAMQEGLELLDLHQQHADLDIKLVPINLCWGRSPTKVKANMGTLLADDDSPSWLRKFFIVLFLGRDTMARISRSVSLRYMSDNHGTGKATAQKLMRVARFHFHRQTTAATGPRLMMRKQKFTALFANPSIKKMIEDESKSKKIPKEKVKKQALAIMEEIAGDYRDAMIRYGESVLTWLWNRLYNGIEVKNADRLRQLAQEGHEIIYVPCHRSHMDYLLLTYVIYHQGLVTPRIAAGINLNFWPAGPIFRKAGAFFIRRSFGGNRLYSTIFREYLGLLFSRGYPVKFYTEGGRSRTGRLLQPKTGMFAMTIQSMLKGIERPLTLVPVYIGYEHVMEVGTYHKELKGNSKQGESILGVFKAIKKLRNYGKGYVSFGEPLNINQFLNQQVPDWRESIDPIDPQKPTWLTPTVNVLANNVMESINKSASLNPVSLIALILLTQENNTLAKDELIKQLEFMLDIQRNAPFSHEMFVPEDSAKAMVDAVIALNKVEVSHDSFGQLIGLSSSKALEMTYYRNNILHTYVVAATVCRILESHSKVASDELVSISTTLCQLFSQEFFLWQSKTELESQAEAVIDYLISRHMVKKTKAGFLSLSEKQNDHFSLSVAATFIDETIQRYGIVLSILQKEHKISRATLEKDALTMAKRLSTLHNINGPEFVDKRAQATIINALKDFDYLGVDDCGSLIAGDNLEPLTQDVYKLVDTEVLQSIKRN